MFEGFCVHDRVRVVRRGGGCAAALALLTTALTTVGPTATATTETACNGSLGRQVVERVVIPGRSTCRLNGTTVRHNVVLGPGDRLIARNARLRGSVHATEGPRSVQLIGTNVVGNIHVREATGPVIIGAAGCRLDPMAGNNIQLVDNTGRIAVCQMTIEGNLHLINNADTVFVRDNRVGNNLHARDNSGRWMRIRGNRIGTSGSGNFDVDRNRSARLKHNRVTNHLTCRGNSRLSGTNNRAANGVRGQCTRVR